MAVWALVTGVGAIPLILLCGVSGVLLGPVAITLGILARGRMRADGTTGEGLAIGGIVAGAAAAIINLALIAVLLANPDLLETLSQE